MAVKQISTRRVAISKSNAQMVGIIAGAAVVTIFCLMGAKSAYSAGRYQAKVIDAKTEAHEQLQANLKAFDKLEGSYTFFNSSDPNIIEGNRDGTGDRDGRNPKIVLDALPSSYDFPALASSLEKILVGKNMKITNITGVDDQLAQQGTESSPTPKPVDMPFSFSVEETNYTAIGELFDILQKSIRPIQVDKMTISGGGNSMKLTVEAHTYYQPGKNVDITKQVIK